MESFKWFIKRRKKGGYDVQRCFPSGSFIYQLKEDLSPDDDFNNHWYSESTVENEPVAISKKDFCKIQWPQWLNPGESAIIIVTPSGNYYIEE